MWCVVVCGLETLRMRRPVTAPQGEKNEISTNPYNEMQYFQLLLYKENIDLPFIFQTLLTEANKVRK